MSALIKERERIDHPGVLRHQAVVVLQLERAVPVDEALAIFVRFDVWSELLREWRPETLDPFLLARLTRPALKRVIHGGEQERDRVDQRAIEIEQDGEGTVFSHTAKLNCPAATL